MSSPPSYRLISTGELEIPTRVGFRLIPGCSCRGVFEYRDRVAELSELTQTLEEATSIQALYLEHDRFKFLCDRILVLNGIDPEWVRPSDLDWLLFAHYDDAGQIQPSPLQRINNPAEPRHPRKTQSKGHSDYISVLAAIASHCSSIEEAVRIAEKLPARLVLGTLEDLAWSGMTTKQKDDAEFDDWAAKQRAENQRKRQAMIPREVA